MMNVCITDLLMIADESFVDKNRNESRSRRWKTDDQSSK